MFKMDGTAGCVCCNNPWSRGSDDQFAVMCGEVSRVFSFSVLSLSLPLTLRA